jgi:folate-binding protein YgfZ
MLEGVALLERPERSLLRLAGKDPAGMLNAVLTNDVPAQDDHGAYALLLNPKGRVQTDLRAVKTRGEILVDTESEGAEATAEILGRYAPFSRVKLERLPDWKVLGTDITPENFPGESKNILERAVSFGKGCYPGQETVARMHYRGSPNKRLYRFELESGQEETPEAGDGILQGEKGMVGPASSVDVVGRLTSVAPLPINDRTYAMGYLARKANPDAPMRSEDAQVLAVTQA